MARISEHSRVTGRKWQKKPERTQMLMELAPMFSATTLALASNVDRATIYRNCPSIGTKRIEPPQTAELLLDGLAHTRRLLLDPGDWPESIMPSQVIESLQKRMDLDALNTYLYAVAGVLRMRPLHLRMFALELAVACNSVSQWLTDHEIEGGN